MKHIYFRRGKIHPMDIKSMSRMEATCERQIPIEDLITQATDDEFRLILSRPDYIHKRCIDIAIYQRPNGNMPPPHCEALNWRGECVCITNCGESNEWRDCCTCSAGCCECHQ